MTWKIKPSLEFLNSLSPNTLPGLLGIEFVEVGDNFLRATMPVNERTVQPFRILHGGASVALAETMGSVASMFCLDNPDTHSGVGLEINANHLSSAKEGEIVSGIVQPIRIGKRIHVWEIRISRPNGKLACISRLTVAIIENK